MARGLICKWPIGLCILSPFFFIWWPWWLWWLGLSKWNDHYYGDDKDRNVKNLIQVRPAADQFVCTPSQTPPTPWKQQNEDYNHNHHHYDHQKIHHPHLQECAHINDVDVEANAIWIIIIFITIIRGSTIIILGNMLLCSHQRYCRGSQRDLNYNNLHDDHQGSTIIIFRNMLLCSHQRCCRGSQCWWLSSPFEQTSPPPLDRQGWMVMEMFVMLLIMGAAMKKMICKILILSV